MPITSNVHPQKGVLMEYVLVPAVDLDIRHIQPWPFNSLCSLKHMIVLFSTHNIQSAVGMLPGGWIVAVTKTIIE